jgi:sucrose phosphorylase
MPRHAHQPATGPQLTGYADRPAETLIGPTSPLPGGELHDVFQGVHIPPFHQPYDGADAGFDSQDHATVPTTGNPA